MYRKNIGENIQKNIFVKIKTFASKQIVDVKTYGVRELLRKFYLTIKILLSIPIYILAILPCLIIRLISPWLIIRIESFPCSNFGNLVERPTLYHCKKKLKINFPKKKYLDFVYIPNHLTFYNKQLIKMWKKKFNFLSGYLLSPIDEVNKRIPGWKTHGIEVLHSKVPERDIYNLIEKYQPLDFTKEEEIYGKKMLNKFGLKDGDKFVCLAVRDNAHQKKKISSRYRDWSYHDYRNQDIDNFVLAAEELAKRGYYIFRTGILVNKPLNSNNPKIIDYANSNLRSDFMDVYLGAKCFFCISTGLGFDELTYFFKRPIALLSVPVGALKTYSERILLFTKHHFLKKEKRKLSLSEIFSHGAANAYDTKIFEQKGIELVDPTPDEIKDMVIEMIESLELKKKLKPEDEELQKTFRNLFKSNIKNPNLNKKEKNHYDKYHGIIKSHFNMKFLRENRSWLK